MKLVILLICVLMICIKRYSDSMKRFLLCIVCLVSGAICYASSDTDSIQSKDYQAACIYRQIIDELLYHMNDREKVEAEEIICNVLENLDCYPEILIAREEMEKNYNKDYVQ